ncbi:MAG: tRNA (adenosine(37)-N6)-threonylcarbamoyltransferase complex ATPase subunit type 1 TsaE [Crocinitomicaceae bacterium]|jgi:tRNA threonylcarbamoyladenosine biosynthesis protein TsaE|nr:tRNA (adenosine(37)-N6)-threonylcarbamoyltransferase complex ATPase subunit type 1 TsaE [Crocinitomicaceae bacterium]MDG2464841.1 tRNA (adenosine(37)-N6)-threonylcarbamoyltransferase complex ATPase subunit type 1 TsaE [Crocinitomicaceae bacterium]
MRNSKTYSVPSIANLPELAKELIRDFGSSKTWVFQGEMGAGKTTLIKAILHELGIVGLEGSPTYSLVNEYSTSKGESVYHFDLYRLNKTREALDIGIEEMLYGGGLCLLEWPEIIEDLLPEETFWFKLSILDDNQKRSLTVCP